MRIHVVYTAIDGTTGNEEFTCVNASRQLMAPNYEALVIVFRDGPAFHKGRKILTAEFSRVTAVYTYEE